MEYISKDQKNAIKLVEFISNEGWSAIDAEVAVALAYSSIIASKPNESIRAKCDMLYQMAISLKNDYERRQQK